MQLQANESHCGRDTQQQLEDEHMYSQIWAKIYSLPRRQSADSEQLYTVQSPKSLFQVTAILAQVYNSMTQWFTCWLIQTSVIKWGPLNGLNLYNREKHKEGRLQLIRLGVKTQASS